MGGGLLDRVNGPSGCSCPAEVKGPLLSCFVLAETFSAGVCLLSIVVMLPVKLA